MKIKKIGFACKYKAIEKNKTKKEIKEEESNFNTKTTTLRFLKDKPKKEIEIKMNSIISHNLKSTFNLLEYVNSLDEELKILRLTSDLLPFYSHDMLKFYYKDKNLLNYIEKEFIKIGDFARKNNIRLSFHPGQFCVLASDNENVIENSILEFEYHADMARMMGYGKSFQDFKCNIHISGGGGVSKFIKTINSLSKEARNILTVENAEYKYGIDDCLKVEKYCPIVLDVHHAWINEESYIKRSDKRIDRIIESWRGVRPTMHYSQSKENLFKKEDELKKLNIKKLLTSGLNKKDLAAHSDMMWNKPMNNYIKEFREDFDIMVEAKNKNIASIDLLKKLKKKGS